MEAGGRQQCKSFHRGCPFPIRPSAAIRANLSPARPGLPGVRPRRNVVGPRCSAVGLNMGKPPRPPVRAAAAIKRRVRMFCMRAVDSTGWLENVNQVSCSGRNRGSQPVRRPLRTRGLPSPERAAGHLQSESRRSSGSGRARRSTCFGYRPGPSGVRSDSASASASALCSGVSAAQRAWCASMAAHVEHSE